MAKIYDFEHKLGNPDHYNSISLKYETVKDLKKEYRRFRKEAKERIKQLEKYGYEDAVEYSDYLDKEPSNMSKKELIDSLIRAEAFVTSDRSTIQGQINRYENLKSKLQDLGYEHISQKTAGNLNDFFKQTKYLVDNKIVSSTDLLDLYDFAIEKNISTANVAKNVTWYLEKMDDIDELNLNETREKAYTKTQLERIFDRRR